MLKTIFTPGPTEEELFPEPHETPQLSVGSIVEDERGARWLVEPIPDFDKGGYILNRRWARLPGFPQNVCPVCSAFNDNPCCEAVKTQAGLNVGDHILEEPHVSRSLPDRPEVFDDNHFTWWMGTAKASRSKPESDSASTLNRIVWRVYEENSDLLDSTSQPVQVIKNMMFTAMFEGYRVGVRNGLDHPNMSYPEEADSIERLTDDEADWIERLTDE